MNHIDSTKCDPKAVRVMVRAEITFFTLGMVLFGLALWRNFADTPPTPLVANYSLIVQGALIFFGVFFIFLVINTLTGKHSKKM